MTTTHAWFFWVLIAWFTLRGLLAVASIGDVPEPITKWRALLMLFDSAIFIACLFIYWGK